MTGSATSVVGVTQIEKEYANASKWAAGTFEGRPNE